jgi:molybdopterin converting factor small subunit
MGKVFIEISSWPAMPQAKLSEIRKEITFQAEIASGMPSLDVFCRMADRDAFFREWIFDRKTRKFYFHVSIVLNGKIVGASALERTFLQDGDRILLIPAAAGG